MCRMTWMLKSAVTRADRNWQLRSVVTTEGHPKRNTQLLTKIVATVSDVVSIMGNASGHRVKRSTRVQVKGPT